jgi:hypothetical protein
MSLSTFRLFVPFSELLAAIIGTIYFYKYKHSHLKYFLFILWYIVLTEFTGWYSSHYDVLGFFDKEGIHYNLWMYNLMYLIFFPVILWMYSKSINKIIYKKWIYAFILIYLLFSIMNWLFIQNFKYEWSELPDVVGTLFLAVSIIFYFIELLKSDKIITYQKKLLFWISIGLLIFHIGTLPFTIKITGYALLKGIHNLFLIVWILAIIMYLLFAFGFIWSDKEGDID